jgi:hypothetical protein
MAMDNAPRYMTPPPPNGSHNGSCATVPEFKRLKYAYGQLLGAADFQAEQSYFREKQRLHNRCLHGYGVVCGLLVHPIPPPTDCIPETAKEVEALKRALAEAIRARDAQPAKNKGKAALDAEIEKLNQQIAAYPATCCIEPPPVQVSIDCGLALDCNGDELVVRRPITVDLWAALGAEERKQAECDAVTLYLSLCYCEQPVDPFRPVISDQCGAVNDCTFGKLRDSVSVCVSLTPPEPDNRCETCCADCKDPCLLLAVICGFQRRIPLTDHAIDNAVRRRIGRYQSAVITGINWVHGAFYLRHDAEAIIGTENRDGGIQVKFSHPIRAASLRRGVVELWRIEGGKGRSGYITEMRGNFHYDEPVDGMIANFRYRQTDREALDYGDRILIIIRCAFILDACCRPVDGANIGGHVPLLPGCWPEPHPWPSHDGCEIPPWGYRPWTSGSGSPGSAFESWIIVSEKDDPQNPSPPPYDTPPYTRGAQS